MLCSKCGENLEDNARVCGRCGNSVEHLKDNVEKSSNNNLYRKISAFIICFLVGGLGVHRFYLGYKKSGIIMLVLAILTVLLIGGVNIVILSGNYNPSGIGFLVCAITGLVLALVLGIWIFIDFIWILIGKLQAKEKSLAVKVFNK